MHFSNDPVQRAEIALAAMAARMGHQLTLTRALPSIAMPLHLALDAAPFLVSDAASGAALGFLKVYEADAAPFIEFAAVVAASRQATALQLAPELLDIDEAAGAMLYALLPPADWRMARREDFDDDATLGAVLDAKRRFHRSASLPFARDPFETMAGYIAMMKGIPGPDGPLSDLPMIRELHPWVRRIHDGFRAAGHDIGPIHGENALSNIMLGPSGRVSLVDFDRAGNADPHVDLASFCLELCSFAEEVERIVELYHGSASTEVAARVRLYMIVDDFSWGCWALLQHFSSARSTSVEFYKYAQNRFMRCRYWLARWDVAALLRKM